MNHSFRITITLLILAFGIGADAEENSPGQKVSLTDVYNGQIVEIQKNVKDREGMSRLAAVYREHFVDPKSHVDNLPNDDLEACFLAAFNAAFYSEYYAPESKAEFIGDADFYFSKLSQRGAVSTQSAAFAYRLYMSARMFNRADDVQRKHPDAKLPVVPIIDTSDPFDPAKPGVFSLSRDGHGFVLTNIPQSPSRQIIVVAGCEISKTAARHIYEDERLRNAFIKGNALWLGSVGELDLDHVSQWNAAVPEAPLRVAYDQDAWPGVDFSSHPNFHFFMDGKLVATHSGWSPEGVPTPVISGLDALGLLDANIP